MGQRFPQEGKKKNQACLCTCARVRFTGRKNAKLVYETRAQPMMCTAVSFERDDNSNWSELTARRCKKN